jgi:hypothetical protein
MATSNFAPEIRQSMSNPVPRKSVPQRRPGGTGAKPAKPADSPAEMAADKAAGIKQNSPQDMAMDAKMSGGSAPPAAVMPPGPPSGGANPAHAMMAASIAHAILGRGGQ